MGEEAQAHELQGERETVELTLEDIVGKRREADAACNALFEKLRLALGAAHVELGMALQQGVKDHTEIKPLEKEIERLTKGMAAANNVHLVLYTSEDD